MKRYLITSSTFTGEIQVLYGQDQKLLFIDFLNCELNEKQIGFFKTAIPVFYSEENFAAAFAGAKSPLNIQEEGYRISFDQFWQRYNKKINRIRCEKLWMKLSEASKVNAYFGLRNYDRHLALNQWKTKADPETYLKNNYWDNEWK